MSQTETTTQSSVVGGKLVLSFSEIQVSGTTDDSTTGQATKSKAAGKSQNTPIYLQTGVIGYMALLTAMLENADSVQGLESNGMMALSADMNQLAENYSSAWMNVMNSPNDAALLADMAKNPQNVQKDYALLSDLGKLTWDTEPANNNNNSNQGLINEDMTRFNADNTSYNQANSFCGGLTTGLNSTVSNITNQVSEDYQQIQSAPLAIQAIIVSIV